jgi:hypothetical protein
MTDRSAAAARDPRDVIGQLLFSWEDTDCDERADAIIAALAAAGFEIREQRSEPVVEISKGLARACRVWGLRIPADKWDDDDQRNMDELNEAIEDRATGDGEGT